LSRNDTSIIITYLTCHSERKNLLDSIFFKIESRNSGLVNYEKALDRILKRKLVFATESFNNVHFMPTVYCFV